MNETQYGVEIPSRIFVGGIAFDTTELELKNYFQMYGNVKDSKIITDRQGVSKGYGFITFDSQEDATRVQEQGCVYFREKKLNIGPAIRKQPGGQFHRPIMSMPGSCESDRHSGSTSPPQIVESVVQPDCTSSGHIYQPYHHAQPSIPYIANNGTWYFPDPLLQPQPGFYVQHLYSQQPQHYQQMPSQVQWRWPAPPNGYTGATIYYTPSVMPDRYIMDSAMSEPLPSPPEPLPTFIKRDVSPVPKIGRNNGFIPRGRRPPRGSNFSSIGHNKPLGRPHAPTQQRTVPHPRQQVEQTEDAEKSPKPDQTDEPSEKRDEKVN